MKRILLALIALAACLTAGAQTTYRFAQRDTCDLLLDIYEPAVIPTDSLPRPTVIYVFGGGFVFGQRDRTDYLPWFKLMTDSGIRVVSIDYRLGLKGQKMGFGLFELVDSAKKTRHAVEVGVEDLFSAVKFLSDNGYDTSNIVFAGSSAGAIISLTAEWEICNHTPLAAALPEGFRPAGVMSFAGAIMSDTGIPKYPEAPCPQLLFHGTADKIVTYKKLAFGQWGFFGSSEVVRILKKSGHPYCFYSYKDHGHDMAGNFYATWPEQKQFLEQDVMRRSPRVVEALVDDPAMPVFGSDWSLGRLYKKK